MLTTVEFVKAVNRKSSPRCEFMLRVSQRSRHTFIMQDTNKFFTAMLKKFSNDLRSGLSQLSSSRRPERDAGGGRQALWVLWRDLHKIKAYCNRIRWIARNIKLYAHIDGPATETSTSTATVTATATTTATASDQSQTKAQSFDKGIPKSAMCLHQFY